MAHTSTHEFIDVLLRGAIGRCPNCGKGKLFRRYLKQVECCSMCGTKLAHIRADDGPAWATILIVGHLLASILLVVVPNSDWPDSVSMIVWPVVSILLALLVLPRAKGAFIGILWRIEG